MANVVFISPQADAINVLSRNEQTGFYPPLGILYLGAMIKDLCDIYTIDAQFGRYTVDQIVEATAKVQPDVVGISVSFIPTVRNALLIAEGIKKANGNSTIVLGGNAATFLADKLIQKTGVDIVVLKEGEMTFRDCVRALLEKKPISGIPGIVYKENNEVKKNEFTQYIENLDELPFPLYEQLPDHKKYLKAIMSSRGCLYECIYCSTKAMWQKWRARSAENLIAEIQHIMSNYPDERKSINFADDNFVVDKKRVTHFIELLKRENIAISWGFSARIEMMDDAMLPRLREANCRRIYFGIESGSDRILKYLKRHYTADYVKDKVNKCIQAGILPTVSFMLGMPWEREEDVMDTFRLMQDVNTPFVQCSIFTPVIGTPLHTNPEKYNMKIFDHSVEEECTDTGKVFHATEHLSAERIYQLWLEGQGICGLRLNEYQSYTDYFRSKT